MELSDFVKYFDRLYTCRIIPEELRISIVVREICSAHGYGAYSSIPQGEWKGRTAGGCCNSPTWRDNPQFLLEVSGDRPVWMHLVLEQETTDELDSLLCVHSLAW